jgi:AcrR family transcriptional regulator
MMTGVETRPLKVRQRKPTAVRKTEIVDAAMSLVAELGGRGFTTKHLAARVGLTEGAIFRHFPSMEAVADAMVDRMEALLFDGFPPEGEVPLERLEAFFRRRVSVLSEAPYVSRLLLSDHVVMLAGEGHGERVVAMKRRSQGFVRECLREAAKRGELEAGVTPATGEVLVVGTILAIGHSMAAQARRSAKGAGLADEIWPLIARALRGSKAPAAHRTTRKASR